MSKDQIKGSSGKGVDDSYESLFPEEPIDYIEERNFLLKDVSYNVVRRAWFTLSHILVDEGSKIVHMGCGDGELSFAMAVLSPKMKFVAVDKSKRNINMAREKYQIHNLEFIQGDVSGDLFPPESVDVIINSFILHIVFSNSRYNESIVSDTLRKHFQMLKNDGIMFIRDYAKPPDGKFVLMEMHDEDSEGDDVDQLCEADLLDWYSEHARPKQDPGCGGFFLEELPPSFPRTRLFRLPFKWAYEFIMRKDNREGWDNNLPNEFTFFTVEEFRRELRRMGARIQYSGPHWDEAFIKENFDGHFRLYDNDGTPLGDPPTSFISVARKMPERESLTIMERRISHDEKGQLEIKALRNEKTGDIVDVVTRGMELAEILPYRITEEGRLNIFLHDGIVRGVVNSVPRSGLNIDGRMWSGHMIEPLSTDLNHLQDLGDFDERNSKKFSKDFLGLKAKKGSIIEQGAEYYPDPNYIDERVFTYYLEVDENKTPKAVKDKIHQNAKFRAKGVIRELNAQTVLDAISVGLIPNGRLELQILALFQHLNMKAENWTSKDIQIIAGDITQTFNVKDFMKQAAESDLRFREVKGAAGILRTVNSVFVEEGQSQGGRMGLSSALNDFVISDDKTVNTAVVIPLTKNLKGDVHAGFTVKHTPVPQRFLGNGLTVSAPQFNIPKEINTFKLLKQFVAEKFGVTPDMVIKLGESYYSHIGVTPERIHPFAIAAPPQHIKDPEIKFMPIYQYMLLWRSISKEPHFMITIARAYRFLPAHMKTKASIDVKKIIEEKFKQVQPDWTVPASFEHTTPHVFKQASSKFGDKGMTNELGQDGGGVGGATVTGGQDKEELTDDEQDKEDKLLNDAGITAEEIEGSKEHYKKKEKDRREKKERKKRQGMDKKKLKTPEHDEDEFEADMERTLDIDLVEDNEFAPAPDDDDPEAQNEPVDPELADDEDYDPDDFDLDEQDLEDMDPEHVNLIEDFEREIDEIRDLIDPDDDPEPKPD